ncbi:Enoyl-CoA delta isomerase 2, mitochondrial [Toxocara canis]|uniref:Enoyl-CoA delta isomerase 2, mitochondrial n=1 Tax=Toxocara canis TaxID=6265 RepID=A0A0B2VIK5_TOXCA|nr:Enoyl-CoA delta isomerase 2, mitochondrial [Toxocara canis]
MVKALSSSSFAPQRLFSSKLDFEKAQADLKKLQKEPGVDVKLKLYALFKQASFGDVSGKRPSALDFAGRAKFDAWSSLKGISKEEAQKQYSQMISSLLNEQDKETNRGESSADELGSIPGVKLSKEGKIFRIELSRPEKYNAITWEMYRGLTKTLNYSSKDTSTAITVFTGAGSYFCSGNDLANFASVKSREDIAHMAAEGAKVLDAYVSAFINHEKPLIALVNGPAIGIAVTVLALFDLVFASDKATFHTPFATLGQSPEGCSTYTFPMLMGHLKAAEMLLFGRKLTAIEAMERNLVNEVIPASSFLKEAATRVTAYSNLPPESLRLNKQILRSVHKERLMQCNKREVELLAQRWQSDECIQAIQSFMSRKK